MHDAAKVAHIAMMGKCLHGEEAIALGNRGCFKKNRTIDAFQKEGNLSVMAPSKKPAGDLLMEEQKAFNQILSSMRKIF